VISMSLVFEKIHANRIAVSACKLPGASGRRPFRPRFEQRVTPPEVSVGDEVTLQPVGCDAPIRFPAERCPARVRVNSSIWPRGTDELSAIIALMARLATARFSSEGPWVFVNDRRSEANASAMRTPARPRRDDNGPPITTPRAPDLHEDWVRFGRVTRRIVEPPIRQRRAIERTFLYGIFLQIGSTAINSQDPISLCTNPRIPAHFCDSNQHMGASQGTSLGTAQSMAR
jgi:hypothetical protein